jgi:DNA-binding PadR family transcriptional regulator
MDTQSSLPLTEVTLLILLSLSSRPKHGYAIMKEVEALSQGRVLLSTGTLYGAIKRLLEQGWIERVEPAEAQENGRARKSYRLTGQGRRILEAETARLQTLLTAAQKALTGFEA